MSRARIAALVAPAILALACSRPPAPEPKAAASPARASGPTGPLPDAHGADGLEPGVRDRIAGAIAAARPLLEKGRLTDEELEVAQVPCLLEHAHNLLPDAADCYARLERIAPGDARWPYLRGHAELGLDDRTAALAAFERALAISPANTAVLTWIGQAHFDLGRFAEARAKLQQAVAADRDNAFALWRLGQVDLQDGRHDDAIRHFEAALALQPGATTIHHALAQALRAAGRDEEADEHAQAAGQVRPALRDPWMDAVKNSATGERMHVERGGKYVKRGELDKARTEFELAVQADPSSVDGWVNLGAVLSRQGDQALARGALMKALALAPDEPDVHFNLGVVSAAEGKASEAISHFRDALRLDPKHAGASFNLGNALLRAGKAEEAIERFDAVLSGDPANVGARIARSRALVDLRRDAEARTTLEQGLLAVPGHPGLSAALARTLATSRQAAVRDGAKAVELATAALNAERSLETVETMAMAMAEVGRFPEAVRLQETALAAARDANRPDLLARIQSALDLYRKNQPLRLP